MCNVIRSNNINFVNEHFQIKNDFSNRNIQTFEEAKNSLDFSIEQQREIFSFEMQEEKKRIINETIINAKVEARRIQEEILSEANKKANEIIAEAQESLNNANRSRDSIENEAFQEGYNRGHNQAEEYIAQSNNMLSEITNVRKAVIEELEPEIIGMIQALFEKVVGISMDTDNQVIVNLIKKTLTEFGIKHSLVIKVSNEDYENVLNNKHYILSELKGIDDFDLVKTETLKSGDCIIQTQSGEIDSSISTQLNNINNIISELIAKKDGFSGAKYAD